MKGRDGERGTDGSRWGQRDEVRKINRDGRDRERKEGGQKEKGCVVREFSFDFHFEIIYAG